VWCSDLLILLPCVFGLREEDSEGSMVALERPYIATGWDCGLQSGAPICLQYGSVTHLYTLPYVPREEQVSYCLNLHWNMYSYRISSTVGSLGIPDPTHVLDLQVSMFGFGGLFGEACYLWLVKQIQYLQQVAILAMNMSLGLSWRWQLAALNLWTNGQSIGQSSWQVVALEKMRTKVCSCH
jgi:hypothetical protein